jgi:uncharacterized circularly permuted ATP-grasp superfamily protein/uncharacterized alpha-E superfamily protein
MQPSDETCTVKTEKGMSILDNYNPSSSVYDEVRDNLGKNRPAWAAVSAKLRELGNEDFLLRAQQVHRIVQDNGITYNAYGDSEGSRRVWAMDPLPMIVGSDDWRALEKGMSQRVRLINNILADIYGNQRLLRTGQIPAFLVHGNPNFLRPCHGFQPHNGAFVHIYAADLARDESGAWRVLADRVDVPSGIGYAVENRFITQQVMSDIFRAAGPVRLKPFFERMLESFETLVQRRTERPVIVLLSPGPGFETYFEQAFFARNLGYPLVEGADLTTRDNCVFLKTVSGLKRVDVIIRNVPSGDCDPLELDSTSMLGVPGLVEAARSGNVVIANNLGTGVMESPAMPAFLDELCRSLLGENLAVPSVETMWCADRTKIQYILSNLGSLVIKPVFRRRSGEAIIGPLLSSRELERLSARIGASPENFCAQKLVSRATIPALSPEGVVEPRRFIMRVFLVYHKGGDYEMMPGALTRITRESVSYSVSMAEGGASKDTWMVAPPDMPLKDHPLPHTGPVRIRRSTAELTSREADNLFWMGRYMERTDYQTRLLRVLVNDIRECSGSQLPHYLSPFLSTAMGLCASGKDAKEIVGMNLVKAEERLDDLIRNRANSCGLCASILSLHSTSSAVKERLSLDAVNILNQLADYATQDKEESARKSPAQRLNNIGMLLAGVSGSMTENMTRATDWRFLDIGRRIERAQSIVELILQVFSHPAPIPAATLSNLLVCGDSRYTYASRYLTNMQSEAVVDLLLIDPTNPRSVAYQACIITDHIANLPVSDSEEPQTERKRLALGIDSEIALADVRELLMASDSAQYTALTALMTRLSSQLMDLSDQLARHYFSHNENKALSSRTYSY